MTSDEVSKFFVSFVTVLNPSYEASSVFGPVSLREQTDDTDSLKGDLTFHPLYPYYGTLGTGVRKCGDDDNAADD